MARPKRLAEKPLHFHVQPQIKAWLSRWASRQGRTIAEVCREVLMDRYTKEAHTK